MIIFTTYNIINKIIMQKNNNKAVPVKDRPVEQRNLKRHAPQTNIAIVLQRSVDAKKCVNKR